ncbi:MAG: hypothetical protein HKN47_22035 [Pirellulaceae bacterium]|nr:hypothetical protein [Pirellulaceae bacterium]
MRQLVQLQKQADEFAKLNAEMMFVFREESDGVDGLKKIQEKVEAANREHVRLGVDPQSKSSAAYSSKQRTFDNYVVDTEGVIRGVIPGTLRDRATAEELIKVLKEIQKP